MWPTIIVTMKLRRAGDAHQRGRVGAGRRSRCVGSSPYQKFATTLLVIPVTLGTVLIADGMLTYFGPERLVSAGAAGPASLYATKCGSRTTTGAC